MKHLILSLLLALVALSAAAQSRLIDAALAWDNDLVFFIKGNTVVSFDSPNNRVLKKTSLATAFPGLTFTRIDAVLDYNNGKIYFFSGDQYTRFDRTTFRADEGYPRPMSAGWSSLNISTFQAAISWPNNKAYFFRNGEYVRYDRNREVTDEGYPKPINNQTWPGLPFSAIDAATVMPNGKMYLFRGAEYVRYDVATDQTDPGYPKSIDTWTGLRAALSGGTSSGSLPNRTTGSTASDGKAAYGAFDVTPVNVSLSPYTLRSPNRVNADYMLRKGPQGTVIVGFQQKNDAIILKTDSRGQRTGAATELKGYWLSDIYPMEDGSMVVLASKDVNNDYIAGYPNTLYFINVSVSGMVTNTVHIFGGDGHGPGKSWFDGRSQAKIAYNGTNFGLYFEVQKNWAAPGQAQDIHNGDMFVVVALNGRKLPGTEHFWTASHSSTVQVAAMPGGEFWTMTIGDAHPFGLQVYNRTQNVNFVAWPPKEDVITYEDCNSANAAGLLRFMDTPGGNLIAIMGTLDHPNISFNTLVDPLFLKLDPQGNILKKKYLRVTPSVSEANISVHPLGNNYVVAFGPGNVYENNWAPGEFELCIIDADANFLLQPVRVPHPFGSVSDIIPVSPREMVWGYGDNESTSLTLYRLTFR